MIGIISDTHDNIIGIKKAIEIFRKNNVEIVIHCGDVVAPPAIPLFSGFRLYVVKGNCDGEVVGLRKRITELGGQFFETQGELTHKGKSIVFVHGHDPTLLRELIESQKYDYVLHGHTHSQRDDTDGSVRVINPGSLYLGSEVNTIALLDAEQDYLNFVEIK